MAYSANSISQTLLKRLEREPEDEVTLANQLSCQLTRVAEQMRIREIQMTMLHAMPIMSLNSYGLHALLMTHESNIRTAHNLRTTRDELLRSKNSLTITRQYRIYNHVASNSSMPTMLMTLPDHPLIEYGGYALECMTGEDMKKATYMKMVRDELLRSMEEKRQLIKNYKEM
ncbi:hypothetical protein Tco_0600710 [Tanacetum coccineum]